MSQARLEISLKKKMKKTEDSERNDEEKLTDQVENEVHVHAFCSL